MRATRYLVVSMMILTVVSEGRGQTIDEVYKKALSEGGTLNFLPQVRKNVEGDFWIALNRS